VGIAYDAAQYANQLGRYEDAIIFVKKYALRWSQDNAEKLRLQNMLKRYEDSMIKDGQRILKQPRTVHQNADKGLVGSRSGRGGFILKGPALENRLKIEKRACVRQIKTRDIFPTYHSASKPLNRNILFKYRQHNLEPEMIQLMEVMVKTLKPLITEGSCVLVVGHTDQSGGENYNLRLSERRAQTVVNYLLKQGLPKHAIQSAGMGKLQPLNPNHDAYAYRQNRRVEFTLLK
jgi:outer membrane protein OmpA-like peptidoglycan-associated protein